MRTPRGLLAGPIGPLPYAIAAPFVIGVQHAFVAAFYAVQQRPLPLDLEFWLLPLRTFSSLLEQTPAQFQLGALVGVVTGGVLGLLSVRRAAWSGAGFVLAALTLVPVLQIPAAAMLALLPQRPEALRASPDRAQGAFAIVQGIVAGAGLVVFAVLVSAVVLRAYGWGLFVLTPLLAGLTTGYLANRERLLTEGRTMWLAGLAGFLGAAALLTLALEGLICLVLASPLVVFLCGAGGLMGRFMAIVVHRPGRPAAMSLAILPMVFLVDAALPPEVRLQTTERVEIAAPPAEVWRALTALEISEPPALPFRLGLAYPVRAELSGAGVGAERLGVFSTGVARERVTEWEPERALGFVVLSQPPAMEEMSPHRHVHAPHLSGYFETDWTRFELQPLPGGRTRVAIAAAHTLRLDPVPYWRPIAEWAIRQNNARVLGHLKAEAEGAAP